MGISTQSSKITILLQSEQQRLGNPRLGSPPPNSVLVVALCPPMLLIQLNAFFILTLFAWLEASDTGGECNAAWWCAPCPSLHSVHPLPLITATWLLISSHTYSFCILWHFFSFPFRLQFKSEHLGESAVPPLRLAGDNTVPSASFITILKCSTEEKNTIISVLPQPQYEEPRCYYNPWAHNKRIGTVPCGAWSHDYYD